MAESIKEQFARDGFVVLKSHFSLEDVRIFKEEAGKILEKNGVDKTGVYVGLSLASSIFKTAAAHPELVAALKEVIGNHIIFLSDKVVFKNAKTDFGSPWHQDYPYWYGSHKFSVWIALDDASPENGCLKVVPGSHLLGEVRHGDISDDIGFTNRLSQLDVDQSKIIDLPASRGDAIIFHDLLFHSSYPNISGKDRWAIITTYKDGTLGDPEYAWAGAAFTVSEGQ